MPLIALLGALLATSAEAQVLVAPRAQADGRTPDPNRSQQELILKGTLLGGHDASPPVNTSAELLPLRLGGYMGFSDSQLQYRRGTAARWFDVSGRGYANSYENASVTHSYGGEFSANARFPVGRKNAVQVHHHAENAPYYSPDLFGSAPTVPAAADLNANPSTAFADGRSWSVDGGGTLNREWSQRTRTDVSYSFVRRQFSGMRLDGREYDQVGPFNHETHSLLAALERSVSRAVTVRSAYSHSLTRHIQAGGELRPVHRDTIDGGLFFSRNLSPTRRVSVSAGGGTIYVHTPAFRTSAANAYWTPSIFSAVAMDFGRSWSVSADYRRSASVLAALTATPDTFVTDGVVLTTGGRITDALELVLAASYTTGRTHGVDEATGDYVALTGTTQLRVRLTEVWSALLSFNRYESTLNGAASDALGIWPHMERNAVRVGLVWQLPLVGVRAPRARAARSREPI